MPGLLAEIEGLDVAKREPLSKHTTWKVGGPAEYFVTSSSIDSLKQAVALAAEAKVSITVIGSGSNLLVSDEGLDGMVIKLSGDFQKSSLEDTKLWAGGGASLRSISNLALKNGLSGLEFAHDIPGTLGAAVKINAGAHGEDFAGVTRTVKVFDIADRSISKVTPEFGYRSSSLTSEQICLGAELDLKDSDNATIKEKIDRFARKRHLSQPKGFSAGSVFKNPVGDHAARLIEEAGCKGLSINGAAVSEQHANFILNEGTAKAQDIAELIQLVRKKVYNTTGIMLETEIMTVGFVLNENPRFRE